MIITYLRSSSYSCHDMCPMKWYLEYGLGWRGPSNKKAEKGTIFHKVMEILAEIKLAQQNGEKVVNDSICGELNVNNYNIEEDIYKHSYNFYVKHSENEWDQKDYKECWKWLVKALEYRGGEFDPRNLDIVKAEQSFDIEIKKPWAMYEYTMPDGQKLEGFLAIKGTIDQVTKIDEETYQILDYKTGRRLNWATGAEKDYAALNKDSQLMMYFYAAQHLYPKIENIQIVIWFINDGGPYTICFCKKDIKKIEEALREKFEEIKNAEIPQINRSWKCEKFCHFGMTTFKGTHVKPLLETREGQITQKGKIMTKCEQTRFCLQNRSEESVRKNMAVPGHQIDKYHSPGEIS